ncbi:hypothetical protein SAY87_016667 [Trapa incisa]|uniref:DUF4378 domain-containing protein n=1 Tax=Trapa incisa TaxID=236973 RepID=A0AAN7LHA7_9MYRT|nr:hypothetical protein SAY87_016667 [Trapa incisa]
MVRKDIPVSRQLEVVEDQPRCLWDRLHAVHHHRWRHVKRLVSNKKLLLRRRRNFCWKAPEHADIEVKHLQFNESQGNHQNEEEDALAAEKISKKEGVKNSLLLPVGNFRHDHPIYAETILSNPCSSKVEEHDNFGMVKVLGSEHDNHGKPRFTKARSFPLRDSSGARCYQTSNLKHKRSEVWFFPRGDKLKIETMVPVCHKNLVPFKVTPIQETAVNSLNSSSAIDHHWWNHLAISQFKGIKQRIRRILKKCKKETLLPEALVDHGSSDNLKQVPAEESNIRRVTRLSSLNESLDKYARLFGEDFGSDSKPSELNNSRSLKLVDVKINAPKTSRRRLSLPDNETFGSILIDNLHSGLPAWRKPDRKNSEESVLKSEPLHDSVNIDSLGKSFEGSEANLISEMGPGSVGGGDKDPHSDGHICDEKSVEFIMRERVIIHGEETAASPKSTGDAELSQESVLQPVPLHNMMVPEANCLSEGVDWRPCGGSSDKNILPRKEAANSLFRPRLAIIKEEESDFNFVSRVLRLGGFFENEFTDPWDSISVPLNPKLFNKMEASELHGDQCSNGLCKHQLHFDLINEALLEIYERQFTYFPIASSSRRFVKPVTEGQRILREVWTWMKQYGTAGNELSHTSDDIIDGDKVSGVGWMDLRWEGECLALDLEDMILDELVDELIHS